MQKLPIYVNNNVALQSIANVPISTEIDYRKLQFLGQLFRLPCQYLAKQIFTNRLVRYNNCSERQSLGFLPDIFRLLHKYNLLDYVNIYFESASFPTKCVWKSVLKRHVYQYEHNKCMINLESELTPRLCNSLFPNQGPCLLWRISRKYPNAKRYCVTAVYVLCKLLSYNRSEKCEKCSLHVENILVHKILFCCCNEKHIALYLKFITQEPVIQIYDLLSGLQQHGVSDYANERIILASVKAFHSMLL